MFYVWLASGEDPYRLYNGLDASYRPLNNPGAEPRPPRFPERVRAFLYACGERAVELRREEIRDQAVMISKAVGG